MVYYNEHDPKAAAWLRELIRAGHIPEGHVDERSIVDVRSSDLAGFVSCHFFAGIGGWPYALRLAGWPDDKPVWTGSCPCQPFSVAGKQQGTADVRHLWPDFCRLIGECRPPAVFGEQVASKLGRKWLTGVYTDLEGMGYAAAGADLCSAGVGAPNIRQRLFWVAYANSNRCDQRRPGQPTTSGRASFGGGGGLGERCDSPADPTGGTASSTRVGGLGNTMCERRPGEPFGQLGSGRESYWSNFDLISCLDGKARRVEPGTFPLAHGIPGRVGLLRGYGNAINPVVAAEFIQACDEALTMERGTV